MGGSRRAASWGGECVGAGADRAQPACGSHWRWRVGARSRAAATDRGRDRHSNRTARTQPDSYGHAVACTVADDCAFAGAYRDTDCHSDIYIDRYCDPDANPNRHASSAPNAAPRSVAGGRDQHSGTCAGRE